MAKPKVMVAVRDPGSVESLVILACQLAHGMDADVTALHVVEVPPVTPLEAQDEVLDHPCKELLAQALGEHPKPANDDHLKTGQRRHPPGH